jgi:hypothetical protein
MDLPNLELLQERVDMLIDKIEHLQDDNILLRQKLVDTFKENKELELSNNDLLERCNRLEEFAEKEEVIKKHLQNILIKLKKADMIYKEIET